MPKPDARMRTKCTIGAKRQFSVRHKVPSVYRLGSRDTRDGTPSSVVEESLLSELAQVHPITPSVIGDPAEHWTGGQEYLPDTGKSKTGGGERYQQHKRHKTTTIARKTTHCALEGFTCGRKGTPKIKIFRGPRNRKARLVAGNNVSE